MTTFQDYIMSEPDFEEENKPLLSSGDGPLLYPDSLFLLVADKNGRKSTTCLALGISTGLPVLFVECEQPRSDVRRFYDRLRGKGDVLYLKGVRSRQERMDLIESAARSGKYGVVVLDSISKLCEDGVNGPDVPKVISFVESLMAIVPTIGSIHTNRVGPASNGALGRELDKIASVVGFISNKGEYSTISCTYSRYKHFSPFKVDSDFCITFPEGAANVVKRDKKLSIDEALKCVDFSSDVTYARLRDVIMEKLELQVSAAEARIRSAVKKGKIHKTVSGNYQYGPVMTVAA